MQWLIRAQDAGRNRGVSYGVEFGGSFLESYPETTGYIIPTFLAYGDRTGDASFQQRAVDERAGMLEIRLRIDLHLVEPDVELRLHADDRHLERSPSLW